MGNYKERPLLGERLRQKREEFNLSQEQLAKKLYVTRQTISGWECGRSEPDIGNFKKIAEIYGVTMDELIDNVNIDQPYETLKTASLLTTLPTGPI